MNLILFLFILALNLYSSMDYTFNKHPYPILFSISNHYHS